MPRVRGMCAVAAVVLPLVGGASATAWAAPMVWGVDPVSGDIVRLDPRTGAILGSFGAPLRPEPGDTRIGLSIAEHGRTLLYQLGNNGPGTEVPGREMLYGLDPYTGAVKWVDLGLWTSFGPDGMSWQSRGASTFTFINHANPIADIHRIENLGRPDEREILFWGPTFLNHSVGGLGGDGNGREFGVFLDVENRYDGHRFIGEYGPFVNDPDFLNTLIAPSDDLVGLAFDGRFLYASSAAGLLYTLDPDTGAIVQSIQLPALFYPDGTMAPYKFDIAAAPEPGTLGLMAVGLAGLARARRRAEGGGRGNAPL